MNSSFLFSLIANVHCLSRFNNTNSAAASQYRHAGDTDEQPMLSNARYAAERLRQTRRIRDAAEMGVDDPVAAIGDKSVTVAAFSQQQLAGSAAICDRCPDGPLRRPKAERNDLDRQRETAERLDPF